MPTTSPSDVDPAKLRGMRQVLDRDRQVVFRATGAVVTWADDVPWGGEVDLIVAFPDGSTRRVNEWATDQFARAYAVAMAGPPPPAPPPPARIKPTRSRTDFGPCPF